MGNGRGYEQCGVLRSFPILFSQILFKVSFSKFSKNPRIAYELVLANRTSTAMRIPCERRRDNFCVKVVIFLLYQSSMFCRNLFMKTRTNHFKNCPAAFHLCLSVRKSDFCFLKPRAFASSFFFSYPDNRQLCKT